MQSHSTIGEDGDGRSHVNLDSDVHKLMEKGYPLFWQYNFGTDEEKRQGRIEGEGVTLQRHDGETVFANGHILGTPELVRMATRAKLSSKVSLSMEKRYIKLRTVFYKLADSGETEFFKATFDEIEGMIASNHESNTGTGRLPACTPAEYEDLYIRATEIQLKDSQLKLWEQTYVEGSKQPWANAAPAVPASPVAAPAAHAAPAADTPLDDSNAEADLIVNNDAIPTPDGAFEDDHFGSFEDDHFKMLRKHHGGVGVWGLKKLFDKGAVVMAPDFFRDGEPVKLIGNTSDIIGLMEFRCFPAMKPELKGAEAEDVFKQLKGSVALLQRGFCIGDEPTIYAMPDEDTQSYRETKTYLVDNIEYFPSPEMMKWFVKKRLVTMEKEKGMRKCDDVDFVASVKTAYNERHDTARHDSAGDNIAYNDTSVNQERQEGADTVDTRDKGKGRGDVEPGFEEEEENEQQGDGTASHPDGQQGSVGPGSGGPGSRSNEQQGTTPQDTGGRLVQAAEALKASTIAFSQAASTLDLVRKTGERESLKDAEKAFDRAKADLAEKKKEIAIAVGQNNDDNDDSDTDVQQGTRSSHFLKAS